MHAAASQKESVVREVMDAVIPGWTIADVTNRCEWIVRHNQTWQTLYVDGEPVLEVYQAEFEPPVIEGDKYVARVTQWFRKLGRAADRVNDTH